METVYCLLPELVLVLVATATYVVGAFTGQRQIWSWVALGGLAVAALVLWQQYAALFWPAAGGPGPRLAVAVPGPLAVDLMAQFLRWLSLGVGALFVLLMSKPADDELAPELFGTLLLAVAGMMLVAGSGDLVLIFLGLELISIPSYILLYLGSGDARGQESVVKYFYLSILSSAVMLYGFSFLYGVAGSTRLDEIRAAFAAADGSSLMLFERLALVLSLAGLCFKIAAAPFHFYAPDVYQATTAGNAGLLAVFPKVAGFAALTRVLVFAMAPVTDAAGVEVYGWKLALILAAITMTIGNVLALWQDNIRRMLAYSSIAHAGYMLIGLAVGFAAATPGGINDAFDGPAGIMIYLVVYALATAGVFAALAWLGSPYQQVDRIDELAGASQTRPFAALALALFMFSMAGIPPLAGFWGKFALFAGAMGVDPQGTSSLQGWFVGLAVVGVLNAAIAAAYYLRVVAVMYFRPATATLPAAGGNGARLAMGLAATLTVLIGLFPGVLFKAGRAASQAAVAEPAPLESAAPAEMAQRPR